MKNSNPPGGCESNPLWMEEALKLAEKAAREDEVPVGAIVVHEGKIVGRGHNRREQDQNPLAHAEVLAIQDAAKKLGTWRLTECVLIVTLEPCPMCLASCQQARVNRVLYGARDPKGGALSMGYHLHADAKTNHRFTVDYEESAACREILKKFFEQKRRK